ncbi:cytochrome b/b6 domain-containing protein [Bosea sp. (in: a-proteobacteria)]|uniref:cytochrome b n=1 Tax=Bosea sp. (in: a-proteobacteria) TaxID=1871050 RepID=UPI00262CCE88|nr:cytochrome b/b6 domain-containing protein [Bosea sp. (in: a-proteobacteria)]MCO5091583.1 cytochrome b/b6 domain-containing protein [Bosea sp. (in: a-proteobacteria)]
MEQGTTATRVYSPLARALHWITVVAVFVMIPAGLTMSYRGNVLDIWDGLTNGLYSLHKLLGFLLLWLTAGRLVYRLLHGAPPDEPTLPWWQKAAAHLVHWLLYGLLIVVPLSGWIGVSLFPALTVFDLFDLPALAKPDEEAAKRVLGRHGKLALALGALTLLHIAAALHHRLVLRDGVMRRMWPGSK